MVAKELENTCQQQLEKKIKSKILLADWMFANHTHDETGSTQSGWSQEQSS